MLAFANAKLTMKHTFTSKLKRLDSQVWYLAIEVPADIGDQFKEKNKTRLIATYNGSEKAFCAFMPATEKGYWLTINKEIRTKLKLQEGDRVDVSLEPDESEYGIPLPEEMEELLLQDELGSKVFHTLTPGKQRSLLWMIGKPKNSDTRLKKALGVMEYLKLVKGKLDFKELNEFMKNFNADEFLL